MPADHRPEVDQTISDDELLYVRVFPAEDALVAIGDGSFRPNSGSFRRGDEALSVDLGSICTPQQTCDRDTSFRFHVAQFTVRMAREAGCRVVRRPEEGNAAHAEVYGNRQDRFKSFTGGLTNGQSERIARQARIVLVNIPPG